jgi:hypothetical protein
MVYVLIALGLAVGDWPADIGLCRLRRSGA